MATWLEDTIKALDNLGGIAEYSELYAEIERIRDVPLPESWTAIVRRTVEQHSSDSIVFDGKNDLFYSVHGLGNGVWGLRRSATPTPRASDIEEPPLPARGKFEIYRILRDNALSKAIKAFHRNQCQLCGEVVRLPDGKTYSEAHHIKPLGRPHSGPDVAANIIVLCPNHHVQCDYGATRLDLSAVRQHSKHHIDQSYIDYHNSNIYRP